MSFFVWHEMSMCDRSDLWSKLCGAGSRLYRSGRSQPKYSLESSWQDLSDVYPFALLQSQNFSNCSSVSQLMKITDVCILIRFSSRHSPRFSPILINFVSAVNRSSRKCRIRFQFPEMLPIFRKIWIFGGRKWKKWFTYRSYLKSKGTGLRTVWFS